MYFPFVCRFNQADPMFIINEKFSSNLRDNIPEFRLYGILLLKSNIYEKRLSNNAKNFHFGQDIFRCAEWRKCTFNYFSSSIPLD